MHNLKITDRHIAFANDIAAGTPQNVAYQKHLATKKKLHPGTAKTQASRIMSKPEMQDLVDRIRLERQNAITKNQARIIAKEFSTILLSVDELDAYHSAIIQGMVEVEEVVPHFTLEYDKSGKVVKKSTSFVRVKRPPNIREKQISISELYKRFGHYAPNKLFGAFGRVNEEGEVENVQRVFALSDGTKLPLL